MKHIKWDYRIPFICSRMAAANRNCNKAGAGTWSPQSFEESIRQDGRITFEEYERGEDLKDLIASGGQVIGDDDDEIETPLSRMQLASLVEKLQRSDRSSMGQPRSTADVLSTIDDAEITRSMRMVGIAAEPSFNARLSSKTTRKSPPIETRFSVSGAPNIYLDDDFFKFKFPDEPKGIVAADESCGDGRSKVEATTTNNNNVPADDISRNVYVPGKLRKNTVADFIRQRPQQVNDVGSERKVVEDIKETFYTPRQLYERKHNNKNREKKPTN